MDWDAAMDQIAARLDSMTGMRRFEEGQNPDVPCAIVSFPDEIDPHGTYSRGVATMTIQAMLLMGVAHERAARINAATYVNDTATGVVSVLEDGAAYAAFDDLTVTTIGFDVVEIQSIKYLAVFIDITVGGRGV